MVEPLSDREGGGCGEGTKPNPRLETLRHYRAATITPDVALSRCLDKAVTAMNGGAWNSPSGDAFARVLATQRTALANIGEGARADIDAEIGRTPPCVADPMAGQPGGSIWNQPPIFPQRYPADGSPAS